MPALSTVRWSWSGLSRAGTGCPFLATLSIKLHLSVKYLAPEDDPWLTLYSTNLECGYEQQQGEGMLDVPTRVSTDGWARIVLHAAGKDSEVYAFCDLPSIMLVTDPKGAVAHTLVLGEVASAYTLRVTVRTQQQPAAAEPPGTARLPAVHGAKPTSPKPRPALQGAASAAGGGGGGGGSGEPRTPYSPTSALAQHAHIKETSTIVTRMGDIDGLAKPPSSSSSSTSSGGGGGGGGAHSPPTALARSAQRASPPPAATVSAAEHSAEVAARAAAEASAAAAAQELAALKEELGRTCARCAALGAEAKSLETRLAAREACGEREAVAASTSAAVADAVGRAAREIKLRQAMDARRAAAEGALAELKEDLRALESERMASVREMEEARRVLGMAESYGLRAQRAEEALEALKAASSKAGAREEGGGALGASLQPASLAALQGLCQAVDGVIEATALACAEAARAAPTLSDIAASFSFAEEEEAPERPVLTVPPSSVRDGSGGGGSGQIQAATATGRPSASAEAPPVPRLSELQRLSKKGKQAGCVILELVRSLAACVAVEASLREGAEGEREALRSQGAAALLERSNLVRDWQKYAEHWEGRGREAEKLLGEWSKAYAALERQKAEAVEALAAAERAAGGGSSAGGVGALSSGSSSSGRAESGEQPQQLPPASVYST